MDDKKHAFLSFIDDKNDHRGQDIAYFMSYYAPQENAQNSPLRQAHVHSAFEHQNCRI